MSSYNNNTAFDASLMGYFRGRIDQDLVNKVNQKMVENARKKRRRSRKTKKNESGEIESLKNQGKLILDATAAPADITYPNDLGILNQARRQTEKILDSLYKNCQTKGVKKPRSYRKKARKDYLKVAKKRRPTRQERRAAIAKQLQYIKRNLSHIENLINSGAELTSLSRRKYKILVKKSKNKL